MVEICGRGARLGGVIALIASGCTAFGTADAPGASPTQQPGLVDADAGDAEAPTADGGGAGAPDAATTLPAPCEGMTLCEPFDGTLADVQTRWPLGLVDHGSLTVADGVLHAMLSGATGRNSARLGRAIGTSPPPSEMALRFDVRTSGGAGRELASFDVSNSTGWDAYLEITESGQLLFGAQGAGDFPTVPIADGSWHRVELRIQRTGATRLMVDGANVQVPPVGVPSTGDITAYVGLYRSSTSDGRSLAVDYDNVAYLYR